MHFWHLALAKGNGSRSRNIDVVEFFGRALLLEDLPNEYHCKLRRGLEIGVRIMFERHSDAWDAKKKLLRLRQRRFLSKGH